MRLSFWRGVFAFAVTASDLARRAVEWADRRFYDAAVSETLAARETAGTCPADGDPWDCLVGGPDLDAEAGEEHAAMVDMHGEDCWPHSGDQRKGWIA